MKAGYGISSLTPPPGVELAGYGYYLARRAESVRDPLYARALLLDSGSFRAAVISCDLLGLSREVCAEVFAHAESLGISPEHLLIVSIHTHTGPAVKYHEGCGYPDPAYVASLGGRISAALDAALEDLDEVTSLESVCSPFGAEQIYNRAIPDAPVDRVVRGFCLSRSARPAIAAVSAACHGVFRGVVTAVSADFAGEVCRLLEARGFRAIYLNGLCGDIDPVRKKDDDLIASFAASVAEHFEAGHRPLPLTLRGGSFPFTLRHDPFTREGLHQAAALGVEHAGSPDSPAARVALIWEQEMLERFDSLSWEEPLSVKFLLLGGVPVLALPFEGYTKIGLEIRSISGRQDALVLGCAEELLGYLPTREDIARGSYAATDSVFLYKRLPVIPGEAERLGEELGRALAAELQSPLQK